MKKTIISLVVVCCLVLSLLPVSVFAASNDTGARTNQFAVNVVPGADGALRGFGTGPYNAGSDASALEQLGAAGATESTADNQVYTTKITGWADYAAAQEELSILNSFRSENGLTTPLTLDVSLTKAAMQRAAEIAVYYSHTRPNATRCFTVISGKYSSAGENIAIGYGDASSVMLAWENSSGHRANILSTKNRSVGIGCFISPNGTACWVQLFTDKVGTKMTDSTVKTETYSINAVRGLLGLSLSTTSVGVLVGSSKTLTLMNTNLGYTIKEPISVTFASSDDPTVATASINGDGTVTVTGVGDGSTTLKIGLAPASGGNAPYTLDVAVTVSSEESGTCGENLTWTLRNGTLTISGTGPMELYSPDNPPWYDYKSGIQSIVIEDGVTSIGDYAFSDCNNLTSITIPEGVTGIGEWAFSYCTGLTSITLPSSVISIGDYAFSYCSSLTGIAIPEGVIRISPGLFCHCSSLTSTTIPASATSIGDWTFSGCDQLSDVYYGGTEEQWNAILIEFRNEPLYNATVHYNSFMQTGWVYDGGKWYYIHSDHKAHTGWLLNGGKWYYMDGSGAMQTGWVASGGKWYYMNSSGAMQTGWVASGGKWYYMNSSGAMQTGWLQFGSKWYYVDGSGAMQTGWLQLDGEWYYLGSTGVMQTGWLQFGSKWYYINSDGTMATGWKQVHGQWYYLGSSGTMATGWVASGGKWYYLNSTGAMTTGWQKIGGQWYYLGSSGAMQTGWLQQGSQWYYLDGNGVMVTGYQTINGKTYRFNSSGVWIP